MNNNVGLRLQKLIDETNSKMKSGKFENIPLSMKETNKIRMG